LGERLEILALGAFESQKGRIEKREGAAREGHGDLRLEHIYFFPDQPSPQDLVMIDCVEFDPRYRCGDQLLDIAFLVMDLEALGFKEEAREFALAFMKTSGELSTDHLLDYYTAYRHLVRGLVRGLQALGRDASPESRSAAKLKAQRHFLMALGRLENPEKRPCLVVLGGLPGTGKSTLAAKLSQMDGFQVFSSDLTRKELAGQPPESRPAVGFEKGIYHPDWTEKTYCTLFERARDALLRGGRALVDASFWQESRREGFFKLSRELGVPFLFFICLPTTETATKGFWGCGNSGPTPISRFTGKWRGVGKAPLRD